MTVHLLVSGPSLSNTDAAEEVVPINRKKHKQPKGTATAPRAPSASAPVGEADFSKIKLRVMDTAHPAGSTTPPVCTTAIAFHRWSVASLIMVFVKVPVGGKKRFHTTYADGVEMVEEYDASSDELLLRKWRQKALLGGEGKWE